MDGKMKIQIGYDESRRAAAALDDFRRAELRRLTTSTPPLVRT